MINIIVLPANSNGFRPFGGYPFTVQNPGLEVVGGRLEGNTFISETNFGNGKAKGLTKYTNTNTSGIRFVFESLAKSGMYLSMGLQDLKDGTNMNLYASWYGFSSINNAATDVMVGGVGQNLSFPYTIGSSVFKMQFTDTTIEYYIDNVIVFSIPNTLDSTASFFPVLYTFNVDDSWSNIRAGGLTPSPLY